MRPTILLVLPLLLLAACGAPDQAVYDDGGHDEAHWTYVGDTGPAAWGSLGTENATCGTGRSQSPINIDIAALTMAELPALVISTREPT